MTMTMTMTKNEWLHRRQDSSKDFYSDRQKNKKKMI